MMSRESFSSRELPVEADEAAPDGCQVRRLGLVSGGSLAHFSLPAGQTGSAVRHRSVDEIWYFLSGRGEMWLRDDVESGGTEAIVAVEPGVSVTVPAGTSFQLRALGGETLCAVAATLPPWPGATEATAVPGPWPATVGRSADST